MRFWFLITPAAFAFTAAAGAQPVTTATPPVQDSAQIQPAAPSASPVEPIKADATPPTSGAATQQADASAPVPAANAPAPEPALSAPAPAPASDDAIVVTARQGPPPGDPVERLNAVSFEAMQGVDDAVVGPVSKGYENGVPRPLRQGLRNVLNNLSEPVNFANYMLQLKPGKALETAGRFAINTTLGFAGLIDVAKRKPINLPYRRNGFGNTFGYYGIGQGPYLFLPLIGPTTVRDLTGRLLDLSLVPAVGGSPFNTPYYSLGTGTVRSLDDRVAFDETLRKLRNDCPDMYAAERDWYLATRAAELAALKGKPFDLDSALPDCLRPEPAPPVTSAAKQP